MRSLHIQLVKAREAVVVVGMVEEVVEEEVMVVEVVNRELVQKIL